MTGHRKFLSYVAPTLIFAVLSPLAACSDNTVAPTTTSGGQAGSSGAATGGSSTGGQATSAGTSSGGMATSGAAGTSPSGAPSGGAGAGGGGGGAGLAGGGSGGGAGGGGKGGSGGGGGAGGSGGSGQGGVGGTHSGPLSNGVYVRTGWTATYTCTGTCPDTMPQDMQDKDTTRAFDGNMGTRWSTGQYQQSAALMSVFPLYFTVDMKQINSISKLTFYAGGDPYDAPGEMDVLVSNDGVTYTAALSAYDPTAPSKGGTETIMLPAGTVGQFIKLKATKTIKQVNAQLGDRYWAIGEMNVYP